jgi:hypothetical protein
MDQPMVASVDRWSDSTVTREGQNTTWELITQRSWTTLRWNSLSQSATTIITANNKGWRLGYHTSYKSVFGQSGINTYVYCSVCKVIHMKVHWPWWRCCGGDILVRVLVWRHISVGYLVICPAEKCFYTLRDSAKCSTNVLGNQCHITQTKPGAGKNTSCLD